MLMIEIEPQRWKGNFKPFKLDDQQSTQPKERPTNRTIIITGSACAGLTSTSKSHTEKFEICEFNEGKEGKKKRQIIQSFDDFFHIFQHTLTVH